MPWVVVKFLDSYEIEVLPLSWLNEDKTETFYPDKYDINNIKKAIKKEEMPKGDWDLFRIMLLRPHPYEDFKVACAKATKCCKQSDASATETELPDKRLRKRNKLYGFDDDDETNESSRSSLELVQFKGHTNQKKTKKSVTTSSVVSTIQETKIDNSAPVKCDNDKVDKEFKVECIKLLNKVNKRVCDIEKRLDELESLIIKCFNINEDKKKDIIEEDTIWKSISVTSCKDLEVLELKLQNENVYNQMIQHLERLGGKDFKDCLRRFLKRLLNDNVASMYSLHGHKKKKVFSQLKIFSVVTDAVQKCYNVTKKEIEITTGQWLAKAPERGKKTVVQGEEVPEEEAVPEEEPVAV